MSLESDVNKTLQFDRAVPANTPAHLAGSAEGVTCKVCNQVLASEYYDINGHSTCDRCRQQLAQHAETPKGFGVWGKAAFFGLIAAILGAILYYAVIAITDLEIGLVAIAIGYMVGFAIRTAASNRGGLRFQILAIVLTYWAVGLAYMPLAFKGMREQDKQAAVTAPATPVSSAALDPAPAEPGSAEPAPEDAQPIGARGLFLGIAALIFLSVALPVLTVAGSLPGGLISAAIIAFGMQQAWRMTAAPRFEMTGPYRIAKSA